MKTVLGGITVTYVEAKISITIHDHEHQLTRLEVRQLFNQLMDVESKLVIDEDQDVAGFIKELVSREFGVGVPEMISPARNDYIVTARQSAVSLCLEFTDLSQERIGEAFGDRDHGTMIYSRRMVRSREETEPGYKQRMDRLRQLIRFALAKNGMRNMENGKHGP